MRNKPNPPKVGEVFPTTRWGDVTVIEYNSYVDVVVQFADGSLKRTATKELRKGMVKNNMQPEVCGVGYLGNGPYSCKNNSKSNSPEYEVWRGMIRRCYDPKSFLRRPTYKNCKVHPDWHNFQAFAEWYTKQKGYSERWHLDKDFKNIGCNFYSEDTCELIPSDINSLLTGGGKRVRGENPIGVYWCNNRKAFIAQIHRDSEKGQQDYLGKFSNKEDAFLAYKTAKETHIKEVVSKYKGIISDTLYNNLYNYQVSIED